MAGIGEADRGACLAAGCDDPGRIQDLEPQAVGSPREIASDAIEVARGDDRATRAPAQDAVLRRPVDEERFAQHRGLQARSRHGDPAVRLERLEVMEPDATVDRLEARHAIKVPEVLVEEEACQLPALGRPAPFVVRVHRRATGAMARAGVVVESEMDAGAGLVADVVAGDELVDTGVLAVEVEVLADRTDIAIGAARHDHADAGTLEHGLQPQADVEVDPVLREPLPHRPGRGPAMTGIDGDEDRARTDGIRHTPRAGDPSRSLQRGSRVGADGRLHAIRPVRHLGTVAVAAPPRPGRMAVVDPRAAGDDPDATAIEVVDTQLDRGWFSHLELDADGLTLAVAVGVEW